MSGLHLLSDLISYFRIFNFERVNFYFLLIKGKSLIFTRNREIYVFLPKTLIKKLIIKHVIELPEHLMYVWTSVY